MKYATGITTSVYEEDLTDVGGGDPRFTKYVVTGFKGLKYRIKVNPGKRPRRKPGESPLDPPRE